MATQLQNDCTPYKVNKTKSGGRGIVQGVGSDTAALYGSLDGENYTAIHVFSENQLVEIALPNFVLIASNTDATSQATATAVAGTTKVFIDETRG